MSHFPDNTIRGNNIENNYSIIALGLYLFINLIFIVKYGLRVSPLVVILGIVLFLTLVLGIFKLYNNRFVDKNIVWLLLIFAVFSYCLTLFVPLESLNVDRWQIITCFCNAVENGEYPYLSHPENIPENLPGPSPFYFVLSYPFYKLNFFEGIPLAASFLWYFCLPFKSRKNRVLTTLLLLISPVYIYEIMVRSTIITNSLIILIWATYFVRFGRWNASTVFFNALLFGMLLNTRNVFIIPVLIYGVYYVCRTQTQMKILWWSFVSIIFFLSLYALLAAVWGVENVLEYNPFRVQSEMIIPAWLSVTIVFIAVVAGAFVKKSENIVFYSCLIFFISAFSTYLWTSFHDESFSYAYLEHFDITYFLFSYTFALYLIKPEICIKVRL